MYWVEADWGNRRPIVIQNQNKIDIRFSIYLSWSGKI